MNNRERVLLLAPAIGLAIVMVGCGSNKTAENASPASNVTSGSLVVFGTDQPTCDVESFSVTITSAALVPQGGGAPGFRYFLFGPRHRRFRAFGRFRNHSRNIEC